MHPQVKMSKKREQMEAERAKIAHELVEYMLDEEEEEQEQNPAIDDREQVPHEAVPEQTTDVDDGKVEQNQPKNMDEGFEQEQRQFQDNGIDLLATILASDPELASDLADCDPDLPRSSSSSYFINGNKK